MLDPKALNAQDLQGLSKEAVVELARAMLAQLTAKDEALLSQSDELAAKDAQIASRDKAITELDREIKFKEAKLERITFELARLKAWKFGARTEAMSAEQRQLL